MNQYDNTNKGVFFTPHENQTLAGQGNLNINGRDDRIVIVREPIKRDGEPQLVIYRKVGVLFVNDRKSGDRDPDYSGPIDAPGIEMRVAGWKGEKDGRRYMSLKASPKQQQGGGEAQGGDSWNSPSQAQGKGGHRPDILDDEIPF